MTVSRSDRFSRNSPCPVCGGYEGQPRGKGERCFGFLSSDRRWAHCTREEHALGIPMSRESNTYPHRIGALCRCGVSHDGHSHIAQGNRKKRRIIVASYDYTNETGELLYQVVRFDPKNFKARRPNGKGGWLWNLRGVERVLYRLPLVLEATQSGRTIYIVEGEKDVHAIEAAGGVATCNPGGAGKWRSEFSAVLRGAQVTIVADKDAPGRKHAHHVARCLHGIAESVQIVEARQGKDASDHLASGFCLDDFLAAPDESPQEQKESVPVLGEEDDGFHASSSSEKVSQADRLVRLVEQEHVELFSDTTEEPWARVRVGGDLQILRCRSKNFRSFLAGLFWKTFGKASNSEALKSALNVIEAKARFEGEVRDLQNRVAQMDGNFWYDLTDRQWRAVRIAPEGWSVVSSPPILFSRYSHQAPQVIPVVGGDLHELLEFTNLQGAGQRLLLLTYIVSCLVPDIPHPILLLHGSQGAAKTTAFRMVRRLVDPSVTETLSMAGKGAEFVQQLAHHWMPLFDNLTTLPDWISDTLCRAVTGEGFSKRAFYTNDDDFIYAFRRCCGLNGINVAAQNPDLLDRCIIFGLDPIPATHRRSEHDLWEEFEQARPRLFGAALETLSRAMPIHPTITLPELPRMADFAAWGCAIAEALGHTRDEFLAALSANSQIRNEEALAGSPVATVVRLLMQGRDRWDGSASQLLEELQVQANIQKIDTKARTWPKAPHSLTRRLNEIRHNLAASGISVETGLERRAIIIRRTSGNSESSVPSVQAFESKELSSSRSANAPGAVVADAPIADLAKTQGEKADSVMYAPNAVYQSPERDPGEGGPDMEVFEL